MRNVRYPAWLNPFFAVLVVGGGLCTLWAPTHWIGWGLLFQAFFLSLGFISIYVAELENDLLLQAQQEVGDWHQLITRLSIYRTTYADQAASTAELQQVNRKFWQLYLRKRRHFIRQSLDPQVQTDRLQPLIALGQRWIQYIEGLVQHQQVSHDATTQDLYQQLTAL